MPGERLGYLDYLREAFRHRVRIGWLGHMPLNQMALAVLGMVGFVNPGFWFLGAAGEVAYLAFLSTNATFQKVIQGRRLLARQAGHDERVQRLFEALGSESRERYRRLLQQCRVILGISQTVEEDSLGTLNDLKTGGLSQLLWLFLRLLSSRELITTHLSQVDSESLGQEVGRLKARLAQMTPDSPLARSLAGTLEIQSKRLENLRRARESFDVIQAELDRIERQVQLLREESAVGGTPEMLSVRLDAVTATLGDTSRWMDQHADLFGALVSNEDEASTALPRLKDAEATPPPPPPPARQKG